MWRYMKIINQSEGIDYLATLASQRTLIPFLGAGFSKDSKCSRSTVPDSQQATELMRDLIISNCDGLSDTDMSMLSKCDFFEMSARFFEDVPETVRASFFKDYFTDAKLPELQADFLKLDWPYIYTINVDDAIENTNLYEAILPYRDLKERSTASYGKKPLYKLHGDAKQEVLYNGDENIVFRDDQYIKSITDPNNAQFINNLKGDFSKNLFFLGCSLVNERDLLHIKNTATEWDPNSGSRIIVRDYLIDDIEARLLRRYGIDIVIQIQSYPEFYKELIEKVKQMSEMDSSSPWPYTNPDFILDRAKAEALNYLGCGKVFYEDKNSFHFTQLHIVRTITPKTTMELKENDSLIVMGRRFSGKTSLIAKICATMTQYNKTTTKQKQTKG